MERCFQLVTFRHVKRSAKAPKMKLSNPTKQQIAESWLAKNNPHFDFDNRDPKKLPKFMFRIVCQNWWQIAAREKLCDQAKIRRKVLYKIVCKNNGISFESCGIAIFACDIAALKKAVRSFVADKK